jgi:hypothetical protein
MSYEISGDDVLFKECVEALGDEVTILSQKESDQVWQTFKKNVPIFEHGSRIDWSKFDKKMTLTFPAEVVNVLGELLKKSFDHSIYVMWNDASVPIIQSNLDLVLSKFDDVTCVGFETWLYNPSEGYIIEYYYLGDLNVGLVSQKKKDKKIN